MQPSMTFADRFFAKPSTKAYGAVSVLVQLVSERTGFHPVSSSVFRPRPNVDSALDRVRHAATDDGYRDGVAAFQRAIADDPPAIFLVWGDRSRAVSSRFDVRPQPGRDVLASLRLWRPTTDNRAGHN